MSLLKPPAPALQPVPPPGGGTPDAARAAGARAPCWRSGELLAGQREAHIEHEGTTYRLRLTSLGKLILTK